MAQTRKTLAVKVSEDFYNQCIKLAHENYMNISTFLRKAIADAYGLEETDTAAEQPSKE